MKTPSLILIVVVVSNGWPLLTAAQIVIQWCRAQNLFADVLIKLTKNMLDQLSTDYDRLRCGVKLDRLAIKLSTCVGCLSNDWASRTLSADRSVKLSKKSSESCACTQIWIHQHFCKHCQQKWSPNAVTSQSCCHFRACLIQSFEISSTKKDGSSKRDEKRCPKSLLVGDQCFIHWPCLIC